MIKILRLDHQGRGIAKINDKIIFISKVLPGEIIDYKIISEKRNYIEGQVTKIIKKSPQRIIPKCKYYDVCGGCNLMHLSYQNQLIYKQEKIANIINKYVNEEIEIKPIIASDNEFNYRNKITVHADKHIGLYEENSNRLINIDECLLVDKRINKIIKELYNKYLYKDEIVIRVGEKETLIFYQNSNNDLQDVSADNIILNNKIIKGKDYIIESLNNLKYKISPSSFFQINTKQTIKMYETIKVIANIKKSDKIIDLYCGTGSIGLFLNNECRNILGIEINEVAIKDANTNMVLNNIKNARFIAGDAKKVIKKISFSPDILIVDPPRSGLFKGMINDIYKFNPSKIIYVSCNPLTLARDLNILKEKYYINMIQPIDLFPNTHHVEAICVLERSKEI